METNIFVRREFPSQRHKPRHLTIVFSGIAVKLIGSENATHHAGATSNEVRIYNEAGSHQILIVIAGPKESISLSTRKLKHSKWYTWVLIHGCLFVWRLLGRTFNILIEV